MDHVPQAGGLGVMYLAVFWVGFMGVLFIGLSTL